MLSDAGGATVNGAYAGDQLRKLKLKALPCGYEDLKRIFHEYDIFFKLSEGDDRYISDALIYGHHPLEKFPANLLPEALEFTLEDFSIMINSAMACILGTPQGFNLSVDLNLIVDLIQKRLDNRRNLFKMLENDFRVLL